MSPTSKERFHTGFTLVELMLVLTIIGIVVAVGVPSMAKSIRGNRLRVAAATVVKAGKYARSMAIMRQQEVRLAFHTGDGRIEVSGLGDAGINRKLDGVKISRIESDGVAPGPEDKSVSVAYSRIGRCTPYVVTLADERSTTITINVDAFAGATTEGGYK